MNLKYISTGKRISQINKFLFYACVITLSVAICRLLMLRWQHVFLVPDPVKDEVGFVEDFNYYLAKGWYESVASGTSPLFNLSGRFIYLFTSNVLISLKLVSVFSLTLMVFIWSRFLYKDLLVRGQVYLIAVLFLINAGLVRSAYFSGCDDPLFVLFISLGFTYLYRSIYSSASPQKELLIAGLFCALALSVRPLFIYYTVGFLFLLFLYYKLNVTNRKYMFLFFLSFLITVFVIQFPSLKEKQTISVHNKDFKKKDVTWAEINYLFLLRNKDRLLYGRNNKLKPTPDEVLTYKKEHGASSLPKTYSESLFNKPVMTIKNFFGLMYLQALPFFRQLGLFYLVFAFVIVEATRKNEFWQNKTTPAFLFYVFFTLLLCITPVVHLEFRWFMLFVFLITVFAIRGIHTVKINSSLLTTFTYINVLLIATANALLLGIW